jgi:hypothetical protein
MIPRVKNFSEDTHENLEISMNNWLCRQTVKSIIDIKFFVVSDERGALFSAMVFYDC